MFNAPLLGTALLQPYGPNSNLTENCTDGEMLNFKEALSQRFCCILVKTAEIFVNEPVP